MLGHLHAILVPQLIGLLNELLHLLHDGLVLLLVLLLGGVLLLWLLIAGRIIRYLLLLRLLWGLIPGVRNFVPACSLSATCLLLGLSCGLFQFFLKFVKKSHNLLIVKVYQYCVTNI